MGRRKNDEIINSQLMEVDIYGDEDTIVETIGQRIRRIAAHILIKVFIMSFRSYFKYKIFVCILDVFEFKTLYCFYCLNMNLK